MASPKKAANPNVEMANEIVEYIGKGVFDVCLDTLDEAITNRLRYHNDEMQKQKKEAAAAEKTEKTVPQPTRSVTVVPEINKSYTIDDKVKVHGGKKGRFLRYFKGDKAKSVLDIGAEKNIVVPTAALRRAATGRKTAAPAKKVAPAKSAPQKSTSAPAKKTAAPAKKSAPAKTPAKKATAKKSAAKK